MTDHYLNVITVRMRGYNGHPLPDNLTDEFELEVLVGKSIDIDQLFADIDSDLRNSPRVIHQNFTKRSWGASGSGLDLIVDVPAILTGLASLPILWDTITKRILRHGEPRVLNSSERIELGRSWLAQSLNINEGAIKVVGLESIEDGYQLKLETPAETFMVEMDNQGVTQMSRVDQG